MSPLLAGLAGTGISLGLCALAYGASAAASAPLLGLAAKSGLGLGLFLAPLGAGLGLMAARRRLSERPLWDAARTASIIAALIGGPALFVFSHQEGALAGLVAGPFFLLPGPLAGGLSAWLAKDPAPAGGE